MNEIAKKLVQLIDLRETERTKSNTFLCGKKSFITTQFLLIIVL